MKCKLILWIAFFPFCNIAIAQSGNPAQHLAHTQAKRMKDSVGINDIRTQKIYQVNLELFYRKRHARSQYATQPAMMRTRIQQFEKERDSLYHYILRPESKYQLYLSKKDNILSAN
jgi:hypothetical protein